MVAALRALTLASAALLLLATLDMPGGFYVLLRPAVFGMSAAAAVISILGSRPWWIVLFGAVAVVWNPIAEITLSRTTWFVVDLVAAAALVLCAVTWKPSSSSAAGVFWRPVSRRLPIAERVVEAQKVVETAVAWADRLIETVEGYWSQLRWIPRETRESFESTRPRDAMAAVRGDRQLRGFFEGLDPSVLAKLDRLNVDLTDWFRTLNEQIVERELAAEREFFDRIEKSPLTDEQAKAVVCFDNRVRVIAAAGSGKTSTMVAKAGYAVRKGLVRPERILALAFNKDAANDLSLRIRERFAAVGLDGTGIRASTFHSFGIDVIGRATGKKPRVADVSGERLLHIIDKLRDEDMRFRREWDLFRIVFARELPSVEEAFAEPEAWERTEGGRRVGFRTLRGEVVRSHGERMIADWLFYNGVRYEYERDYEHDVADAKHSQYRPDFYYPDIGVYHEHWALGENGVPPAEFHGYAEEMRWKIATHRRFGTALIETTWGRIHNGEAFDELEGELTKRGVVLDPNPDRPTNLWARPTTNEALAQNFGTFLNHVKSNDLSHAELEQRLTRTRSGMHRARHAMFLRLFDRIRTAWDNELRSRNEVDFNDMLNLATRHLNADPALAAFDLVLVDELQDTSIARARMIQALIARPDCHLFAVGDDWQSINRFAGADLSVMTRFEVWFGATETRYLEHTFRFPQSIASITSRFAQANPTQLRKAVTSMDPGVADAIRLETVADSGGLKSAVGQEMERIEKAIVEGSISASGNRMISVLVLGRYRHDEQYFTPTRRDRSAWRDIQPRFMTVHRSKGVEADFIIIPSMVNGRFGFPSEIEDDPVLSLAMPEPESYRHAEERRLLYVALTRARQGVTLFTVVGKESEFVAELIALGVKSSTRGNSNASAGRACPTCGRGMLVIRRGPSGEFLGCTRYPMCSHTERLSVSA